MPEITITCPQCSAAMVASRDLLACSNDDCGKTQPFPPAYEVARRGGERLPGFSDEEVDDA